MKGPSFDLGREPWIECENKDGRSLTLGLEELFLRAHELRRLTHDNPLAEAGIFRLLLAMGHRIVEGPADRKSWRRLYEAGHFDAMQVSDYFDRWSDRFDLFHPDYPFLQIPRLHYLDAKNGKPLPPTSVSELLSARAAGNNPTLIDHTLDSDRLALHPSEAASALIEHYFFKPGGLFKKNTDLCGPQNSCKNGTMVGGMSVFLESLDPDKGSLFATILLNLLPLRLLSGFQEWGRPVWECRPLESYDCGDAYVPKGYLDYLTVRSRNIRLVPDADGTVSGVYTACGAWMDERIIHPFSPYRIDGNERKILNLSADKALWREADTLFRYVEDEGFLLKPLRFAQSIDIEERCGLLVYGMINDKAKVHDGVRERLPLPHRILRDPSSAALIEEMIRQSEREAAKLVKAVDTFVTTLDQREHSKKKTEDRQAAIREAKTRYFTELKLPFYRYLKNLDKEDLDTWLQRWQEESYRMALRSYHATCYHFGNRKKTWHLAFVRGERKLQTKGSA